MINFIAFNSKNLLNTDTMAFFTSDIIYAAVFKARRKILKGEGFESIVAQ